MQKTLAYRDRDSPLQSVNSQSMLKAVVRLDLDVSGSCTRRAFAYVVPGQAEKLILGTPWIEQQNASISPDGSVMELRHPDALYKVYPIAWYKKAKRPEAMMGAVMAAQILKDQERVRHGDEPRVFAATMADIEKALRVSSRTDPKQKVPHHYWKYLGVFDEKEDQMIPHRPGIDMAINLKKGDDGHDKRPPWGPLYSMSRDELLVLRKTLLEHLDKGYIRASQSAAAAPVLFTKKPGGGLRFCVDYRGLNDITVKDRYPIPLIHETLRQVAKAKWLTKLDVRAAFHKIRVREGDEWKTAFNTRYGLYEWNVVPFGLSNGPAVFQRYINWVLRRSLDNFCSAYIDDVLIYTDGTKEKHQEQVCQVLAELEKAGLQLDVDKCEFEVRKTKYLGFIVEADKGISMDPAKIEAIMSWEAPKTAKGVRSFLGFANFYRVFIKNFAELTAPLVALTGKSKPFIWGQSQEDSFQELKKCFVSGGLLAGWDPDLGADATVVESDASGFGVGGRLLQ
ncbi:Pol-like protein [Ceratocystis lukuohia]|uniref:Pol-like protein n=1 Tax=Ceratocystis lukuohia TaxID=2019550 RepID=A0ABR4MJZ6_9PEZI